MPASDTKTCTCANRRLSPEECVFYLVPTKVANQFTRHVFAKDCPVHGYSTAWAEPVNHTEESLTEGD